MEFVKDFLIYEAGALCGFFIAALMNAARAGQEITIKFEEDKHGTGKEHPDGAENCTGAVSAADRKSTRLNSSHQPQSRMPSSA